MYVTTEGGLRYLGPLSRTDPMLLGLARRFVHSGASVWDVGANVGLFAFAAASRARSVLALERDITLVRLLRRTTAAQGAPVDVLPVAVSGARGVERFVIARRLRSTNHLEGVGTTMTGGIREQVIVPTVTLDWLATQFPLSDLVKIDIEGAELIALRQGQALLERRPILICEVADEAADGVGQLLHGFGYTLHDGGRPGLPVVEPPPCSTVALPPGVGGRGPAA